MQFLIKSCFPVNHYQQNIELGLLKKYTLAICNWAHVQNIKTPKTTHTKIKLAIQPYLTIEQGVVPLYPKNTRRNKWTEANQNFRTENSKYPNLDHRPNCYQSRCQGQDLHDQ